MKKINSYINNQSGQMVILVMLVLVIALTIGLSLISRTITNTRLSTNTELANRAYSAAEAGIEEALRPGGATGNGTVGSGTQPAKYTTTVSTQGGTTDDFVFPNPLSQDETVQLWLFDYATFSTSANPSFANATCPGTTYFNQCNDVQLSVLWGTDTTGAAPADANTNPALELSLIYLDNSGAFQIEKCAYDPYTNRALTENNFSNVNTASDTTVCNQNTMGAGVLEKGSYSVNSSTKKFSYRKKINLSAANSSNKRYLLMRMKMLYNDAQKHEIAVSPKACSGGVCNGAATLPAQGKIIDSEGNAGEVVRKIRVYQSYPTLPGIFDFVLFNGSNTPLSKN